MALSKILPASQEQYAGARNLLTNGAFAISQRGTSFTAGGYSLDHWFVSQGGTCTLTQDTADVPTNFKYAAKVVTSAGSSFMSLYQPFESVDYEAFKNKTVTVSFYAKVNSTFSGTMFVDLETGDTADTLLGGTFTLNDPQTITPTTSWARYTASIAVGSTNGIRFVISPSAAQASGAEYSFTGVQLEIGEQATPFEHRSYGDEFARCQRYYEEGMLTGGVAASNTGYLVGRKSPLVEKRGTPTISIGSWSMVNQAAGSQSNTAAWSTAPHPHLVATHYPGVNYYGAGGNGSVKYTADSEL